MIYITNGETIRTRRSWGQRRPGYEICGSVALNVGVLVRWFYCQTSLNRKISQSQLLGGNMGTRLENAVYVCLQRIGRGLLQQVIQRESGLLRSTPKALASMMEIELWVCLMNSQFTASVHCSVLTVGCETCDKNFISCHIISTMQTTSVGFD